MAAFPIRAKQTMAFCCRCGKIIPIKTTTCSIDCDKIIIKRGVDKDEETTNKCAELELPDEIWVDIIGKLPIKSLCICKCVSKTWHSHASRVIDTYKGIHLPPHGLLCDIVGGYPPTKDNHYVSYLCFGDGSIKRALRDDDDDEEMSMDDDRYRYTIKFEDDYGVTLLSGIHLTLDLTSVVSNTRNCYFWTLHRGLVLTFPGPSYHVYNPTTGQGFVLPTAPSHIEQLQNSKPLKERRQATVINLSDCLLSTQSNFRVVKFSRERKRDPHSRVFIEVYCSNKHQWFQSEVHIEPRAASTVPWFLGGTVYLENTNTLFFMTTKRHLVAVKFDVLSEQVLPTSVYTLRLPRLVRNGCVDSTLHGSQGCLYLFYKGLSKVWIWKHNGISVEDPDAWTPVLIFGRSGMTLCQPATEKYFRQCVANGAFPFPMIIHPEAPLVYFNALTSIFAIHLLNDTVEKITELKGIETFSNNYIYMYSPCFSSFKCPAKPVNQTCDDRHLRIKGETDEINV